jgi:CHAT domain-containing protein/Tfp pilus assembly protein PilF
MKRPHTLLWIVGALLIATFATNAVTQKVTRQEQLKKYQEDLAAHRAAGERAEEATALTNVGMVYNQLGERLKAMEYLNQALSLHKVVGNQKEEARTLVYMGYTSSGLSEREKALEYFTRALRISEAVGDVAGEATALWASSSMYGAFGEVEKSLDLLNLALVKSRAAGDRSRELHVLAGIGSTYNQLGDGPRALEYYNEALPRYRALGDSYSEGLTLNNIGIVYAGLRDWPKALEYFERALPIMKTQDDRRWTEAMVLTCIGQAKHVLGNNQQAIEYLNEALTIHQSVNNRSWEAHTLLDLGMVYDSMGQADKALDYFKQALAKHRVFGNYNGQANTLLKIARMERNRGNLSEARKDAEAALEILESLRAKVVGQESRSSFFASRRDYYAFYVDLLMRLDEKTPGAGHAAEALKVSELAHARSLLEILTESRADIRQGIDAELLDRERALQRQINDEELRRARLPKGKQSPEDIQASEKRVNQLLEEYNRLQSEIRLRSPRYSALKQPVPLTLPEIQQQVLDDKTMLLEYSLGEEKSYLWVVTQTELKSFALPKRSVIEAAARRAYDLLMVSNKTQARRPAELALAELGRMVLGPVASLLKKERLVIVADGALEYVPFAALPIASGSRGSYEPLIARYEVVSLPSASVLSALRREQSNRQRAPEALAVLADAVFQSDDSRLRQARDQAHASVDGQVAKQSALTRSASDVGVLNFERLPFSRREADIIVAKAGEPRSLKALDFAASRQTLFNSKLDQYRIVHFATHGLLNSQHPSLSGIVLSLYDTQGKPIDGFLRAHEIYNLKLNAELVVLSACRTALGREIKGEGLVGLTRGFMYAGTPSVVASLWDVRDQATSELMSRFYEGMFKEGKRPAAALRAAQLSLWKEKRWAAPYFWAGFVLQGEWR